MFGRDAINDVTLCKIACDGDDRLEIAETVHNGRDSGNQLPSLSAHVAAEQRSGFCSHLEEAAIEECRRQVGYRDDFDEAGLDLVHLLRGHVATSHSPFAFVGTCAQWSAAISCA